MKLLEVKLLYAKVLYVKFVCVWSYCMLSVRVWGRRREEEAAPGIQNQKQEPHTKMWGKTQCFATFLPFRAPGSSFFWDFLFFDIIFSSLLFSSLTLPTSAFDLSILSEVWLLNFLRLYVHPQICHIPLWNGHDQHPANSEWMLPSGELTKRF